MSEATFDEIAEVYEETLPAHVVSHYLDKRVRWIEDRVPRGKALDVGCGTGILAGRLAARGYEMSGIDPSSGMLKILAERAPEVDAQRASGEGLPFEDASFDLTLSVATFHHIAEPGAVRRTLGEMVRVTRPGGRILIWDHNPRNPYWRLLMARVPQDDGSERLIREAEIRAGLEAAGCGWIEAHQLGFVPDFAPPSLLPLAASLEHVVEQTPLIRRLCAHNVVFAARD